MVASSEKHDIMMNLHHQKTLSDDPIRIVRIVGYDFYQLKWVKFVVKYTVCVVSVCFLLYIFGFIFIFDLQQMICYGPHFLLMAYPTYMMFVLMKNDLILDDLLDLMKFLDVGSTGEHMKSKIINESRYINIAAILTTLLSVLSISSFVFPNSKEYDTIYACRILRKLLPVQNIFLDISLRLPGFMLGLVPTAHAFQILYITQHTKFQLYMINEYLKILTDRDDEESVNDEVYQEEVGLLMKFYISRHTDAIRLKTVSLNKMGAYIMPSFIAGTISVIGFCCVFILVQFGNGYNGLLRLTTTGGTGLLIFLIVFFSGQSIQDESEKLFVSLTRKKWYNWNRNNKKMLLIALCNCLEPMKIEFSSTLVINYDSGVALCKMVYSAVSLFVTVVDYN